MPSHFKATGFFVLRTPLFPFETLAGWSAKIPLVETVGHDASNGRDAWDYDATILRSHLVALIRDPWIDASIYLASPSLSKSISNWLAAPDTKSGIQTERALVRYLTRLCTRPTPFGLFAGVSFGTLEAASTPLQLAPQESNRPYIRMDHSFLWKLIGKLRQNTELVRSLPLLTNSTFHRSETFWYYLRSTYADPPSQILEKLVADPTLDSVLTAGAVATPIRDLVAAVQMSAPDATFPVEAIYQYLMALHREDALCWDIRPACTVSPAEPLAEMFADCPDASTEVDVLIEAQRTIVEINNSGLPATVSQLSDVNSDLSSTLGPADKSETYIHVDLLKPLVSSRLDPDVASSLLETACFLATVGSSAKRGPSKLDRFKQAFERKYGTSWIPLLDALNEETGITLDDELISNSSSLIKNVSMRSRQVQDAPTLTSFYQTLLNAVIDAAASEREPVDLRKLNFDPTSQAETGLPDTFSLLGVISRDESRDRITCVYLGGSGPSGITNIARFGYLDPKLSDWIRIHTDEEERLKPDCIFAEIDFCRPGKLGNVLATPPLRNYRICYGLQDPKDSRQTIPLNDLVLTLVGGQHFVLYSLTQQKRIVPRLSSAHLFNSVDLPPIYRFLCYLQYEPSQTVPNFDWGPLTGLRYKPRLLYGDTVVSPASWHISREECAVLEKATRTNAFARMQDLRKQRGLPRWITFKEGSDQTLTIDLCNVLSVDAFIQVLKKCAGPFAEFFEVFPDPSSSAVCGPGGHFTNEVIIPFSRRVSLPSSLSNQVAARLRAIRAESQVSPKLSRRRGFGDEWLYFKIYATQAVSQNLLPTSVQSAIHEARRTQLLRSWFFIRYCDPDHHIRLRLRADSRDTVSLLGSIVERHLTISNRSDEIWKLQMDTYTPEYERYGGRTGMEIAEAIFEVDSDVALEIAALAQHESDEDLLWRASLLAMDQTIRVVYETPAERAEFVNNAREIHFGGTTVGGRSSDDLGIGSIFRGNRRLVQLNQELGKNPTPAEVLLLGIASKRQHRIQPILERMMDNIGSVTVGKDSFIRSVLHMLVNRYVKAEQNMHEAILYGVLWRHYERDRHSLQNAPFR